MENLAQAHGYTGASQRGLNTHASYHRMIYENRERLYTPGEIHDLLQSIEKEFQNSDRSRLVIRILLRASEIELENHARGIRGQGWQISHYPHRTDDSSDRFYYTTYSQNKRSRSIGDNTAQELIAINQSYIERALTCIESRGDFHEEKLAQFHERGFHLTKDIGARELSQLWKPFGWSEEACQNLLRDNREDFVLGVRTRTNSLIASILYSHQPHTLEDGTRIQHGELTEAATAEAYRGNGIMGVLATALHVTALSRGIQNIYGEYRALGSHHPHAIQSLRFALESGVRFGSGDILLNHVDVDDIIDDHNQGRHISGYGPHADQLKSFVLGSLDPRVLSDTTRELYMSSIT